MKTINVHLQVLTIYVFQKWKTQKKNHHLLVRWNSVKNLRLYSAPSPRNVGPAGQVEKRSRDHLVKILVRSGELGENARLAHSFLFWPCTHPIRQWIPRGVGVFFVVVHLFRHVVHASRQVRTVWPHISVYTYMITRIWKAYMITRIWKAYMITRIWKAHMITRIWVHIYECTYMSAHIWLHIYDTLSIMN